MLVLIGKAGLIVPGLLWCFSRFVRIVGIKSIQIGCQQAFGDLRIRGEVRREIILRREGRQELAPVMLIADFLFGALLHRVA